MSDAEIPSKYELEDENRSVSPLSEDDQDQLQQQVETKKPSRSKKNKLEVPKKQKKFAKKKIIKDTQSDDDVSQTDESELSIDESENDMSTEEHQNRIESQEKENNPRTHNLFRDTTQKIWTDQDLSTVQQEMLDEYLQLKQKQNDITPNGNMIGSNPLQHLQNGSTTYSPAMAKKEQEIKELRAEIERLRFENAQLKSTQKTTDETTTNTNIIENGYKLDETPKIDEIKIFEAEKKRRA